MKELFLQLRKFRFRVCNSKLRNWNRQIVDHHLNRPLFIRLSRLLPFARFHNLINQFGHAAQSEIMEDYEKFKKSVGRQFVPEGIKSYHLRSAVQVVNVQPLLGGSCVSNHFLVAMHFARSFVS